MDKEEAVKQSQELYLDVINLLKGKRMDICLEALAGCVASICTSHLDSEEDVMKRFSAFNIDVVALIDRYVKLTTHMGEKH